MQRRPAVVVLLLVFGLLGVLHTVDNPRYQSLHGSDIVRLVGVGMCFGAALGIWFGKRKFPGE